MITPPLSAYCSLTNWLPFSVLKAKLESSKYEVTVSFQGCSKAGLCYAPMSEKYLVEIGAGDTKNDLIKEEVKVEDISNLNETDTIANSLKDGNILIVLATFFGF